MNYFRRILPLVFMLLACTGEVEPPELSKRFQRIPLEACKKTSLDLRQLTTDSFRNFFECINGEEGTVQAYVNLLNSSLKDKELEVLLSIYNKHLVKENRFKKILEYVESLNDKGFTNEIYGNLYQLTKMETIPNALPVIQHLYESGTNSNEPDEAIVYISKFLVDLMDRGLMTDTLMSVSRFLSGARARIMASNLSRPLAKSILSSGYVIDELADSVYRSISTNGFHELAILGLDPKVFTLLKSLIARTPEGVAELNSFLYANVNGSLAGLSTLAKVISAADLANGSQQCFADAKVRNLYSAAMEQLLIHKNHYPDLARYFLAEASMQMSLLNYQCRVPATLYEGLEVLQVLVAQGYARNISILLDELSHLQRLEYLRRLLTSPEVGELAYSMERMYKNRSLPYLLEIFEQEVTKEDFQNISNISTLMVVEGLQGTKLKNWLFSFFSNELASSYWNIAHTKDLDLIELIQFLDKQSVSGQRDLSSLLRLKVADVEFPNAPEVKILPFFQKIFSPRKEFREDLKNFARSLLRSWSLEGYGLGLLMGNIAETLAISKDTPIQDFLRDLLTDKAFVTEINPILYRLYTDPLFLEAVKFTGQLAGNGELKRLVDFFVALGRSIQVPGLNPEPMKSQFTNFRGNIDIFRKNYYFEPSPIGLNYSNCDIARLPLIDKSGNNFYKMLQCANDVYGQKVLLKIADSLRGIKYEDSNLLTEFSNIVGNYLFSEENGKFLFLQMQSLTESGYLPEILEALSIGLKSPYDFDKKFNDVLLPLLREPSFDQTLKSSAEILLFPKLQDYVKTISQILWKQQTKVFTSYPVFLTRVDTEPGKLEKKAKKWKLDLTYSELKPSDFIENKKKIPDQDYYEDFNSSFKGYKKEPSLIKDEDFERIFTRAKLEYVVRNDAYYHRQGAYPAPFKNLDEKLEYYKKEFKELVKLAVRPGLLLALHKAFLQLHKEAFPYKDFFQFITSETDIIKYWVGKKKRPELRMVNTIDQMELLVQNANLKIASWVPVLGVDHVGTHFQINIANTDKPENLGKTLKVLKNSIKQGLAYTKTFRKKWKRNRLYNIRENFVALEKLQERNYLRIFYYIYKYLQEATPERYKKEHYPPNNYMPTAHYPTRFAFMGKLVQALQSLESQGNLDILSEVVDLFFTKFTEKDIQVFSEILKNLVVERENGSLLEISLEKLWPIFTDEYKTKVFNESLLPFIHMAIKTNDNFSVGLQSFRLVSANPQLYIDILDFVLEEILEPENLFYSIGNGFHYLDNSEVQNMLDFHSLLLAGGNTLLLNLTNNLNILWATDRTRFSGLRTTWLELKENPYIREKDWQKIFIDLLNTRKSFGGIVKAIGLLLADESSRGILLQSLRVLAEEGLLVEVVDELEFGLDSGKLLQLFELVRKYYYF